MSDDLTRAIADALHADRCADDDCGGGDLGEYDREAAVVLDALAPLIEARVREARADAWDEGHAIGALDQVNLACFNIMPTPNPYRKDETDE